MKRFIVSLLAMLTITFTPALVLAGNTAAVDVFKPCDGSSASASSVCTDASSQTGNPFISAIKIIILIIGYAVGIVSFIIIIISGFRMVTSGGDSQAVAKARGAIVLALVGLIVAAVAQAIVSFILVKL